MVTVCDADRIFLVNHAEAKTNLPMGTVIACFGAGSFGVQKNPESDDAPTLPANSFPRIFKDSDDQVCMVGKVDVLGVVILAKRDFNALDANIWNRKMIERPCDENVTFSPKIKPKRVAGC